MITPEDLADLHGAMYQGWVAKGWLTESGDWGTTSASMHVSPILRTSPADDHTC